MRFNKKRIITICKASALVLLLLLCTTFNAPRKQSSIIVTSDTALKELPLNDESSSSARQVSYYVQEGINTGNTTPTELLNFARTLIGTPYLYASTDPEKGFDCSGFITYVFNHFGIAVPRSSVDFTTVGKEVDESEARPGDLILFTGTDSTIRVVGHMGIITSNQNDLLEFIHSTSGKQKGVVITPMKEYYRSRFVKIVRVFDQNS